MSQPIVFLYLFNTFHTASTCSTLIFAATISAEVLFLDRNTYLKWLGNYFKSSTHGSFVDSFIGGFGVFFRFKTNFLESMKVNPCLAVHLESPHSWPERLHQHSLLLNQFLYIRYFFYGNFSVSLFKNVNCIYHTLILCCFIYLIP